MNKLDSEWRRQNLPPYEILQELGISEEDTVADIGCGIGYFTLPMSEMIKAENIVYALDTSEDMLIELDYRAQLANFENIKIINTDEYDFKLNDKMVSFSLLVNVLHEIDDKVRFINEIKRILKPNGKISIIEWDKRPTEMGPALEHRLDKYDVKLLFESMGFTIVKETSFADCFYGIVCNMDK